MAIASVMRPFVFQYQQKVEPFTDALAVATNLAWVSNTAMGGPVRTGRLRSGDSLGTLFQPALVLDTLVWNVAAVMPGRRSIMPNGLLVVPFLPPARRRGVIEDKIVLGQNQSVATGFQPSIGGGQTW